MAGWLRTTPLRPAGGRLTGPSIARFVAGQSCWRPERPDLAGLSPITTVGRYDTVEEAQVATDEVWASR
jgi:hypothetical protein